MANDGQIVFEVTADGKHAIADIKEITRAIQQETGKWDDAAEEATGNIESSFSGMLKKIAAGFSVAKIGKALLDIGKEAISAASDLQEVQNVVDVTFGSGANQIETWAKAAGTQFGLTETQAKRFTSTLGAMMKSSGLAGDEIVTMSTDLAGLAADMASFYNLDFDTAFQKIRSGISGETEPLKQLGINMSVANLEAYALQQGLSKTFSEMTQGEQTMLRYQYMMQATADAQGDFARTSDGYANAVRTLETNLTNLKTNLGTVLLDVINPLLVGVNSLFPSDGTNRHSILDDITAIQIKKDEKIAEINAIKGIADELILTLESIGGDTNASTQLSNLAASANSLDSSAKGNWQAVLSSLQGIDGLQNLFGDESNAVGTVEDLAAALAGESVTTSKAQAWQLFLSALADNADAVSKLTGQSAEETAAWLEQMATAAGEIDPADAQAWNELMGALLSGVGMGQTDEGKKFVELLAQNFLALGNDSEEAVSGLKALGFSTDEIQDKQAAWLRTCKELVKQIPGLSSIIDTNTGEVKGGIPAIKAYADEWERTAKYQAEVEAIRNSRQTYEEQNNPATLQAESVTKRAIARAKLKGSYSTEEIDRELDNVRGIIQRMVDAGANDWEAILKSGFNVKGTFGQDVDTVTGATVTQMLGSVYGVDPSEFNWVNKLYGEGEEAVLAYAEAVFTEILAAKELPEVLQGIEQEEQRVQDEYGVTAEELEAQTKAAEEAAAAMTTLEKAANGDTQAMTDVKNAVTGANEALKAMADYAQSAHEAAATAVDNVAKSLNKVDYQSYGSQIEKISALVEKQAQYKVGSDEWKSYQDQIDSVNESLVNTNNIYKNLESQAQFLDDYIANLQKAREMGLSDALLAELSDGSVESAEYLDAIVNDKTGKTAEEIDAKYQEIQEKKAALSQDLAEQQLTVDQTYQALAEKAKEAIAALDLGEEAKGNAADTIQGIADGINEKEGEVATAVNGIISELERLNGYGIDIDFGGFGKITFTTTTGKTEGSGRMGIPLVPHDDYIARLHEGERVLTAQENQIWNALRNGGVAGFDLETLGGVMRDNVKAGGNVYLDGRVVGSVISDQQGKAYRQLQRSGWQS